MPSFALGLWLTPSSELVFSCLCSLILWIRFTGTVRSSPCCCSLVGFLCTGRGTEPPFNSRWSHQNWGLSGFFKDYLNIKKKILLISQVAGVCLKTEWDRYFGKRRALPAAVAVTGATSYAVPRNGERELGCRGSFSGRVLLTAPLHDLMWSFFPVFFFTGNIVLIL